MLPKPFEKPMGFRDFPPELVGKQREIQKRMERLFAGWGYQEVMTPTLEYYDTVGKASAISGAAMWKCLDAEGKFLVLRPDQTAPIARMASTVLKEEPLPLRLFYHGRVFRKQEAEAGRHAEVFQSGVELIGESRPFADAEVIQLALESLKELKLDTFCVTIGHIALLDDLLQEQIRDPEIRKTLKEKLALKDLVGFSRWLERSGLDAESVESVKQLLRPRTGSSFFQELRRYFLQPHARAAVDHLEAVWSHLMDAGAADAVMIDLTLVGRLGYYTGIYFEGVTEGMGYPLFSGGRYDELYSLFGNPLPATGFALQLDRLVEACPIEPPKQEKIAILYADGRRQEALKQAESLRREGKIAVLQPLDGCSNTAWLQKGFAQVIQMGDTNNC